MLIENPAAVTKTASKAAKDFLTFVAEQQGPGDLRRAPASGRSTSGVTVGTVKGANDPSNPFPAVQKLTTVAQLGGWKVVNDKFFGPTTASTPRSRNG